MPKGTDDSGAQEVSRYPRRRTAPVARAPCRQFLDSVENARCRSGFLSLFNGEGPISEISQPFRGIPVSPASSAPRKTTRTQNQAIAGISWDFLYILGEWPSALSA